MAKFVIYRDLRGEYRWRFRADNQRIIAESGEGYTTKANCIHGIEVLMSAGPRASIEDESEVAQVHRAA